MTAQHALERQIADVFDPQRWKDVTIVVAVSGGPDSVALLLALQRMRLPGPGRLIVAHFNHQLRPESADELRFVEDLASQLQLPIKTETASAPTVSQGDGVEAAARDARYEFLKKIAGDCGARYVLTGHNADDQVETILQRILRGTSLRGLAGIPFARALMAGVSLLRPLLKVPREQVLDYLRQAGQTFCQDASNDEPCYLRNRIRNELLPTLEADYQATVRRSLSRLGWLAEQSSQVLAEVVQETLPRVAETGPDQVRLRCDAFAQLHPHLARLVLVECWGLAGWPERDMTADKWELLRNAVANRDEASAAIMLPGSIRLTRQGGWASMARLDD